MKIWCDFESYSEVNIRTSGGKAYIEDDSTVPICLAWALDDDDVRLWTPAKLDPQPLLDAIEAGASFYAHNATFDFRLWNTIMVRDFGWPEIHLKQVIDTGAICLSFSLPLSLKDAGKAMSIAQPKQRNGTKLIKKLCGLNKHGEQPMPSMPEYRLDFEEFYDYCRQDVRAMREIVQVLPRDHLILKEQKLWELTYTMNSVGLPIAIDEVKAIKSYLDEYVTKAMKQVPTLTNGAFQKITQVQKMKDWCEVQGYPIPNTQAPTIIEALADPDCPDNVKEILTLRQRLGGTATAKYKKVLGLAHKGELDHYWVYDNLIFHGAGPGRWTGRGFQMHNLPRASVPDPDETIKKFIAKAFIPDPVYAGKALVRPIVKAPNNWSFVVSDYNSIENRLLAWFAGDTETLEGFSNGFDQYIDMASARYGVSYEEILAGKKADDPVMSRYRQVGKVIILGCGYQMGGPKFQETAKLQFGLELSLEDSKEAVGAYREKYPLIVDLWSGLMSACVRAVLTGQRQTYGLVTVGTSTVKGVRWLAIQLPTKKCIYYKNPAVEQRHIPKYEHMGTVPAITHEGRNPYTRKWSRLVLTPGRITENVVQGTAREVMGDGMLNIAERMPEVTLVGTVHDEALSLIEDVNITESTLDDFSNLLCDIPWAKGCPLSAEGFIGKRYKK